MRLTPFIFISEFELKENCSITNNATNAFKCFMLYVDHLLILLKKIIFIMIIIPFQFLSPRVL